MKAYYMGKTDDHKFRTVELEYDEYNDTEEVLFNKVVKLMNIKGWDISTGVPGWGCCEVEDRDEFNEFMKDWKDSKHCIKNCAKYGF
jgi:hypothetical protein